MTSKQKWKKPGFVCNFWFAISKEKLAAEALPEQPPQGGIAEGPAQYTVLF